MNDYADLDNFVTWAFMLVALPLFAVTFAISVAVVIPFLFIVEAATRLDRLAHR